MKKLIAVVALLASFNALAGFSITIKSVAKPNPYTREEIPRRYMPRPDEIKTVQFLQMEAGQSLKNGLSVFLSERTSTVLQWDADDVTIKQPVRFAGPTVNDVFLQAMLHFKLNGDVSPTDPNVYVVQGSKTKVGPNLPSDQPVFMN